MADALPFYERYLAMPPANRDGFVMVYSLRGPDGSPPPAVTLIRAGRRTPLQLGPGGRITPPTDLATVRATQVAVSGPASITLDLMPVVPLGRRIPVSAIANSLDDYDAGRRAAGPLAVLAPRLRGVEFPGVAAGEAEFGDGRRMALPRTQTGAVVFRPNDRAMRGAVALVLASTPTRAAFNQ